MIERSGKELLSGGPDRPGLPEDQIMAVILLGAANI